MKLILIYFQARLFELQCNPSIRRRLKSAILTTTLAALPPVERAEECPALLPRATLYPEVDYVSLQAVVRRPVIESQLKVPVMSFTATTLQTRGLLLHGDGDRLGVPEVHTSARRAVSAEPGGRRHVAKAWAISAPGLPRPRHDMEPENQEGFECTECPAEFENYNNFTAHVAMCRHAPPIQGPAASQRAETVRWGGYVSNRMAISATPVAGQKAVETLDNDTTAERMPADCSAAGEEMSAVMCASLVIQLVDAIFQTQ